MAAIEGVVLLRIADADGVLHWLIDGQQGNFQWTGKDTFAGASILRVDFFLAVAAAILGGGLAGAACERALLRPLAGESIDTTMLATIGLWIVLQNGELLAWGGVARSIAHPFPTPPVVLSRTTRRNSPVAAVKRVAAKPIRHAKLGPHTGGIAQSGAEMIFTSNRAHGLSAMLTPFFGGRIPA